MSDAAAGPSSAGAASVPSAAPPLWRRLATRSMDFLRWVYGYIKPKPVPPFAESFDSKYGTAHPPFLPGTYEQALAAARSELKLLLVYIHSSLHPDADQVARQLTDPEVVAAVNEGFLLWVADVRTVQGYRAATALQAPAFPFFAIVASTPEGTGRLATRVGTSDASVPLARFLRDAASSYGATLALLRSERGAADSERRLRAEQEREYQMSLQRDREAAQRARAEAEAAAARARAEAEAAAAERAAQERAQAEREAAAAALPPEPPADASDVAAIQLRLPEGRRAARRFRASDTLANTLQRWATAQGYPPRTHALVMSYPRRRLEAADADRTLSELGLAPHAALFVEEL